MNIDWQNATVAAVVLAAVAFLVRAGWRTLAQRKAGCGACSACPAVKAGPPAIVTLDMLAGSANPLASRPAEDFATERKRRESH